MTDSTVPMICAQTRRFRRTAAQLLLLWVFAFVVGGVNACVVAMTRIDAAPPAAATADDASAAAAARGEPIVGHAPLATPGDDGSAPGDDAACARSCSDRSHTVVALKQAAQPSPDFALVVQPFERFAAGAVAPLLAGRRAPAAPLAPAAPIPIALRRLAL